VTVGVRASGVEADGLLVGLALRVVSLVLAVDLAQLHQIHGAGLPLQVLLPAGEILAGLPAFQGVLVLHVHVEGLLVLGEGGLEIPSGLGLPGRLVRRGGILGCSRKYKESEQPQSGDSRK